jgi:Zn-dependent M28 family amino/carboxypeptidase
VLFRSPEEIAQQKANIPGKAVIVSSNMPPGDKRWIHRMEKYMRALEAGAAAFLFVNGEPGDMPITGGLPVKGATIPGVGLSYEDGEALVRILQVDDSQRIRLKVGGISSPVTSWNVVGEIPGAALANELIIVGGHLDSHDLCAGATDNACGIALILEAARVLGQQKGKLARTLRFVAFGVEELGLIGSGAYVEAHKTEMPKIQFMLNLDMTGAGIANALSLQGCPELAPYFKELAHYVD